jgi:glycosyltransferase involved in cell wall biosynthesis
MTAVIKYYEGIDSVAVIGNYLPRQCGIATFTTDLVEALSAEAPEINCWAVAMNDRPEGYAYPEKVGFEINQNKLADYNVASEFLNIDQPDIVCVQHEFGIFGGKAGSHLLKLLGELRVPVVTTLHTILKDPAPEYREVMIRLLLIPTSTKISSAWKAKRCFSHSACFPPTRALKTCCRPFRPSPENTRILPILYWEQHILIF